MYTPVPSAYEPPTAFPLLCPPCSSNCFSLCMHGGTGCDMRPVKLFLIYGWAGHVYAGCTAFERQRRFFVISPRHSLPLWCPSSTQPFLPSALQDIYELKDQIQDVEGRYMQGLKELKVEGLELTACLLLLSGSSMASLTIPMPHPPTSPLIPLCTPLL